MTGKVSVTPGRWIGMGWTTFREDVGNFILITLIGLSLSFVSSFVVAGPVLGGFFLAVRRRMLEQRTDLNDLFEGFGRFIDALLAFIVTFIFLSVAFLCCIFPFFIVAALYLFTYPFLMDRKLSFWDAMESSRKLVAQNLVGYTIFVLSLTVLNILGLILAVVGLLVTVPVSVAAVAAAYNETVGFAYKPAESQGPINIP